MIMFKGLKSIPERCTETAGPALKLLSVQCNAMLIYILGNIITLLNFYSFKECWQFSQALCIVFVQGLSNNQGQWKVHPLFACFSVLRAAPSRFALNILLYCIVLYLEVRWSSRMLLIRWRRVRGSFGWCISDLIEAQLYSPRNIRFFSQVSDLLKLTIFFLGSRGSALSHPFPRKASNFACSSLLFFTKVLHFSGFWNLSLPQQEVSEAFAGAFPKQMPVEQGIAAGNACLLLSATEEERGEGPRE